MNMNLQIRRELRIQFFKETDLFFEVNLLNYFFFKLVKQSSLKFNKYRMRMEYKLLKLHLQNVFERGI